MVLARCSSPDAHPGSHDWSGLKHMGQVLYNYIIGTFPVGKRPVGVMDFFAPVKAYHVVNVHHV